MKIKVITILLIFMIFEMPNISHCDLSNYNYGLYLYKKGKYSEAVLELERYMFFHPNSVKAPYANYLVALSLANIDRLSESMAKLKESIYLLEENWSYNDYKKLLCELKFQYLNILYRQKMFIDFLTYKDSLYMDYPDLPLNLDSYIENMTISIYIYNLEWEKAQENIEESKSISERLKYNLKKEVVEVINTRRKSPVVGGLLSIIPGLGHIYAGRSIDGIRSLFFNTLFTSLTYFSYKQEMPFLTASFGGIEIILYLSNIYGGVNSVLKENAEYIINKRNSMLKNITVAPLNVITVMKELDF